MEIFFFLSLSASGSESDASPEKRVRVGESSEESQRGPKQKNRRRCHRCQTKLELVQQELGSCRCGQCFSFCHHETRCPAALSSRLTRLWPPACWYELSFINTPKEQPSFRCERAPLVAPPTLPVSSRKRSKIYPCVFIVAYLPHFYR